MNPYVDRMIRAARLETGLYEEVEADKGAMGQAIGVVVLSSLAAGTATISSLGLTGVILGTLATLISWFVWAYLIYFIGTKLLPEPQTHADHGQLLRTLGFSSSPGLIRILGLVPFAREIVFLAASIWMLVAMVVAVKQALDYESTFRALGVCAIGWLVQLLLMALFFSIFGNIPQTPQPIG